MEKVKNVFQWLVYSSANPDKLSLTLKAAIPFLVLFKFGDSIQLGGAVDTLVNFIVLTATWISGGMLAYGAIRKVITTAFVKE